MELYLDNSATTSSIRRFLKKCKSFFEEFGNASSLHTKGRSAKKMLEEAQQKLQIILDAEPSEIIFTSGGTERK
jgi:cysteine desulfurase